MPQQPDLKRAAQTWADRGWSVFPCRANKQPATARGFHDATRDAEKIDALTWPMIGGVPASAGLVVLDIDKQAGASLADIPADGLDTRRHRTRSGGWHLIYRAREGAVYGNGPRPDIGAGIDIRHADGYVILPPSPGYQLDHDVEPGEAPAWLEVVATGAKATAPNTAAPIPRGQQDHELRRIANDAYGLGLDEAAVREVIRSTIATRCQDQDPSRPWTERDIERLARPVPDKLEAAISRGELDDTTPLPRNERPKRGLRLYTSYELAELPPVEFLLQDVLVKRGFNVLAGPSGGGKSFMAIDWSAHVATNGGRVVYVMAEGAGGAYNRIHAWAAHHAKDKLPGIDWLVTSFDVMADAPELLDLAGPRDLIVFDTLHRVTPGIDENSATEVGRVIKVVDYVRETSGAATLLVHHSGWNDERERGSSALRAAADIMVNLRPHKGDDDGLLELRCTKTKEAEHWQTRYYRIEQPPNPFAKSAVIVPADAPSIAATLTIEMRVLDLLDQVGVASGRTIESTVEGRSTAIREALKNLEAGGRIERGIDGWKRLG